MYKIAIFSLILFIAASCSSSKTTTNTASFVVPGEEKKEKEETREETKEPEIAPANQPVTENANYRVQIIASKSYDSAYNEKKKAESLNIGAVYLEELDGYWKVRVGDYMSRDEAAKGRNFLSSVGWKDAWIVNLNENPPKPSRIVKGTSFQIQITATNDRSEAEEFKKSLEILGYKEPQIIREDGIFKVRVGNFTDRTLAEKELKKLRELGFDDSWIYVH